MKSTLEWNLTWKFAASEPIHDKIATLKSVVKYCSKLCFYLVLFRNFIITRYDLLRFWRICAKVDKAREYSRHVSGYFTIWGSLKMQFCLFRKIGFSNFKMNFTKCLMKKSPFWTQFFKALIKCYYLTKSFHVGFFDSIMAVFLTFFAFHMEAKFLCLLLSIRQFTETVILKWSIPYFVLFWQKKGFMFFVNIFHI